MSIRSAALASIIVFTRGAVGCVEVGEDPTKVASEHLSSVKTGQGDVAGGPDSPGTFTFDPSGLTIPKPALAGSQFTQLTQFVQFWDSLEGATPWTRWEGGGSGDGAAGYDLNGGVALSGANDGWLHVGNGWAANRIAVDLNGFFIRNRCAAGVYANVLAPGAQVGLQIWNPNGWTTIAETYPWIVGDGTYHLIVINNLDLSRFSGVIYLQFIYGNSDNIPKFIRFDDMVLQCSS